MKCIALFVAVLCGTYGGFLFNIDQGHDDFIPAFFRYATINVHNAAQVHPALLGVVFSLQESIQVLSDIRKCFIDHGPQQLRPFIPKSVKGYPKRTIFFSEKPKKRPL